MKIKTIISSICLMLLAVACSMEDDVLRDMEIGDSGNVEIEMGRPLLFLRLLFLLWRQNPYLMLEHYLLLWMRQRLIIVR